MTKTIYKTISNIISIYKVVMIWNDAVDTKIFTINTYRYPVYGKIA